MAFIKDGAGTASLLRVETDTLAGRSARFPGNREGAYYIGEATGIYATPAANAEFFHLRNPNASTLVVVDYLRIAVNIAAGVTTAQEFPIDLFRATSWTVDGTGGTALLGQKIRASMPNSVVGSGNARISTTAALGAGTKTLDTQRFATFPGPNANAAGQGQVPPELVSGAFGEPIIILAQNEGLVARNLIAWATGSARFHVRVAWREILIAEWP